MGTSARTIPDGVSRRYCRLLRMHRWSIVVTFTIAAVLVVVGMVSENTGRILLVEMIGRALLIGLMLSVLGATVIWSPITHFECPACGKRFNLSALSSVPTSRCKHCGLYLGDEKPAVVKKSPAKWSLFDEL